jgi:integrase
LRPHEISKIILRDIDLDKRELSVRTSKLGLERIIRLNPKTNDLLRNYIGINEISNIDSRLFATSRVLRDKWRFYRKRAFDKFRDTELLKIRLYDLRHWFATKTYLETRDIFFVKYLLGHIDIFKVL